MTEECVPTGCRCACHHLPGVSHIIPCCDQPPMREPEETTNDLGYSLLPPPQSLEGEIR